jgi:outer membrane protein assembly factor BamB
VVLDAPLGDRTLYGCGEARCDQLTDDLAVVRTLEGLAGLDLGDGTQRWERRTSAGAELSGQGAHVIVRDEGGDPAPLDPATGRPAWSPTPGDAGGAPGGLDGALVIREGPTLAARDAATGAVRWRVAVPAGRMGAHAVGSDVVVALARLAEEEGLPTGTNHNQAARTQVVVFEGASGALRWIQELPGSPTGVHLTGDLAVVRVYGAVYGLSLADGQRRWGQIPFPGHGDPVLDLDGKLLRLDRRAHGPQLLDPTTGEEQQWPGDLPASAGLVRSAQDGLLVWSTDDGEVVAVGADDGRERWRTDLRTFGGPSAIAGGRVVVPTPLGAVALDPATGADGPSLRR